MGRRRHGDGHRQRAVHLDLDTEVQAAALQVGVAGDAVADGLVGGPDARRIDAGADQVVAHGGGALAGDAALGERVGAAISATAQDDQRCGAGLGDQSGCVVRGEYAIDDPRPCGAVVDVMEGRVKRGRDDAQASTRLIRQGNNAA